MKWLAVKTLSKGLAVGVKHHLFPALIYVHTVYKTTNPKVKTGPAYDPE